MILDLNHSEHVSIRIFVLLGLNNRFTILEVLVDGAMSEIILGVRVEKLVLLLGTGDVGQGRYIIFWGNTKVLEDVIWEVDIL